MADEITQAGLYPLSERGSHVGLPCRECFRNGFRFWNDSVSLVVGHKAALSEGDVMSGKRVIYPIRIAFRKCGGRVPGTLPPWYRELSVTGDFSLTDCETLRKNSRYLVYGPTTKLPGIRE